jgi:hypothetical protein
MPKISAVHEVRRLFEEINGKKGKITHLCQ